MSNTRRAHLTLGLSTLAFTLCFAVWMLNGVLVTWLIDNRVFAWTSGEMGLLIGVPVLTGSVLRLVSGLLTDKFGGRPVFTGLLLLAAVPTYLLSLTSGFYSFLLCSACFGVSVAAVLDWSQLSELKPSSPSLIATSVRSTEPVLAATNR